MQPRYTKAIQRRTGDKLLAMARAYDAKPITTDNLPDRAATRAEQCLLWSLRGEGRSDASNDAGSATRVSVADWF